MIQILVRKFLEVLLFLLFITFVSFLFIRLAPGDPVLTILNVDELSVSQVQVEALREEMGFNEPLLVQYGHWLLKFIQLDFGTSYMTGQPVMDVIFRGYPLPWNWRLARLSSCWLCRSRLVRYPLFTGIAG